jgi:hypothetical protein
MYKLINIFFLKKKRFLLERESSKFFQKIKVGIILFFEYVSVDRDFLFKYKMYGLCVGKKNNYMMSLCYLNSNILKNKIKYVFYLMSPFIFNLRVLNYLTVLKSKIYNIDTNIRMANRLISGIK